MEENKDAEQEYVSKALKVSAVLIGALIASFLHHSARGSEP